ncbi:MAG: glycosyltransferase family 2 protein, partial [Alphaproteobacteria bacterium]|nr:glycosyltransferase family 2 protein [Alphaproteobacteria bacterium]
MVEAHPVTGARPTLSVCVPTRNRLTHLERCLDRLFAPGLFPFPIEVVLSDNASTDDTPALAQRTIARGLPLRYQRHDADIGPHANIFSAFRRARGAFCLYLADDDGLDAANLIEAIAWLRDHPACVASYGPIHTYDAVDNVSQGLTYALDGDVEFDGRQRLALARFVAEKRIIPEVGVLRTEALANTLFMSRNIYWPFAMLDRLVGVGSVQFRAKPHYVSLRRQWPGDEVRITACLRFGLEEWESCRRGLRLLYDAALVAGERPSAADQAVIER